MTDPIKEYVDKIRFHIGEHNRIFSMIYDNDCILSQDVMDILHNQRWEHSKKAKELKEELTRIHHVIFESIVGKYLNEK